MKTYKIYLANNKFTRSLRKAKEINRKAKKEFLKTIKNGEYYIAPSICAYSCRKHEITFNTIYSRIRT